MIKSIKLFPNDNVKFTNIINDIERKFIENGFKISDDNYDLAIAIGGDGSFLRMIHENNFNHNICYVGINMGTLGFSQDVNIDQIDLLIDEIKNGKFSIDDVCILETIINSEKRSYKIYSMNEIVLRNSDLKTIKFDINIGSNFFERYVGDALLISTPFGSTAENLSYGGSIVYNSLPSLQITPVGPINSSKYKTIKNSVLVPYNYDVELLLDGISIYVISDGKKKKYNNVFKIITNVSNAKVKLLRLSNYNFESKINYKMLN